MLIIYDAQAFKISSIFFSSEAEKIRLFLAARLSLSCATELAPIKTEVTLLSFNNQAIAI